MEGDDEDDGAADHSFGGVIDRALERGLIGLVAGKEIQKAISRLVYGVFDVGKAHLERHSQRVRTDTAAEKAVAAALASRVKATVVADPAMVARATDRWTRKLLQGQARREEVAERTLTLLAEGERLDGATSPEDDFMDLFEEAAERASREALADLMARILAGEIRKPGSISRRTLQIASILDAEIVGAIQLVQPFVHGEFLHLPNSARSEFEDAVRVLASASLMNEAGLRAMRFDDQGKSLLSIGGGRVAVFTRNENRGSTTFTDGANLTPMGVELLAVLPSAPEEVQAAALARTIAGYLEHHFIARAQFGNLTDIDAPDFYERLEDWPRPPAKPTS